MAIDEIVSRRKSSQAFLLKCETCDNRREFTNEATGTDCLFYSRPMRLPSGWAWALSSEFNQVLCPICSERVAKKQEGKEEVVLSPSDLAVFAAFRDFRNPDDWDGIIGFPNSLKDAMERLQAQSLVQITGKNHARLTGRGLKIERITVKMTPGGS